MGEMVASSSKQMLLHLRNKFKYASELFEGDVNELVLLLGKIEKLLNNDGNSRKVTENITKIWNLVYTIEDALETLAVKEEEVEVMPSKNEKKRRINEKKRRINEKKIRIPRPVRRRFRREDEGIKWFHDTFPEVFESEGSAVLDRSLAHRKSLQRPRLMYTHDMEDHFVEMKEEKKKLLELVTDQGKQHRVVSIYGVKGLGKTNLARRVYIHPKVRDHFNAFAWVSLNQDYQIEDLLQNVLNQLDPGALKKSTAEEKMKVSEEKKENLLHGMKKPEAVKKSAEEQEKGVEEKKGGVEEKKTGVDEMKEGAQEEEKGVEEKKRGAEEKGSRFTNIMRIGAGKKSAAEHKKGVEEKKVGVDETKERAQEQEKGVEEKKGGVEEKKAGVDETKEGAQEQEKGVEEKKRGAEEKGSLFTNIMRIGAGKKKGVADHKKGAEKKKEGVDETKEGAQEQQKVVEEKKEGGEEKGSLFTNIMRIGAGKKSAAEHKKGAEEKKEGVDEKKEGAEEQDKGTEEKKEGVVKQEKGAEEKKEGAEEKRSLSTNIMRIGAGKKSAAEHKKGAEEKKEGVDETKEGAEAQSKSSEETVVDKLKKILINQRCFIVIDDVSEYSQWDYIRSEFLMQGAVTGLLLVTENEEIAGVGLSLKLRRLNDDEGWELLQKYAFRGKNVPELGLIMPKLGKEMVQQCGGLPSEISRLGRTLSKISSLSEWHKVNDDVAGYLKRKAEQSEWNERHDEQSDPISYDELTYGEKQCFLYLAMFKEDEGVDPEDLSFLWMAEGMVSTDHQLEKTTIMDTTEYYQQKLASMLHVQVDELSTNTRLSLRKDLREWSLHLGEREDFRLKVVDFSGGKQPRFDRYTLSDGTRRVVIHFNKLSSPREKDLNATINLRSLLFLNSDREYVNIPVKISDFSEFKLLRVLHFVRCKFEGRELPEGIWKLLYLRYFGVLYCDLDKLPTSITNCRNLQVLNVRSYDDSKIVIPDISQMKSLKHVRLPSNLDHEQPDKLKLKLNGLLDLETLDGFNADIHDLNSLYELKELRHLSTRADSNASLESIIKFVKSHGAQIQTNLVIEHKCDLTSPEAMIVLEEVLMCPNLNALTFSMVVLCMFPNCGKFASKQLTQIKLIGCKLREDPMEALGKFPNLRKLWLGYGAFVGTKMAIRDGGFPNLEYLEFRCLPNLEEWTVDKGAMKKLSTLIVTKCPKLKTVSDGLEIDELPPTALAEGVWPREKSQHQAAS